MISLSWGAKYPMNFRQQQAISAPSISIPANWSGFSMLFRSAVSLALIPGALTHASVMVALIAGQEWHWTKNEASYSFRLRRPLLIFMAPIVPVKIFLP